MGPPLARVAAELLGVGGVRLYHDQALFKEPGGGPTPWHQDQIYWPFDSDRTITMWMPLVDIPDQVGSMTFASGSQSLGDLGAYDISDASDEAAAETVAARGLTLFTYGALDAGDATFHRGWTLHRAGPNPTTQMREVMTIIWFADGAPRDRARQPVSGLRPGGVAQGDERRRAGRRPEEPAAVAGALIVEGVRPLELYLPTSARICLA